VAVHKGASTNEALPVDPKLSPSIGFQRSPDKPASPNNEETKDPWDMRALVKLSLETERKLHKLVGDHRRPRVSLPKNEGRGKSQASKAKK